MAQSFERFNAPLTEMLRTRAAQADRDAESLGALQAQETHAANRLGELETLIKGEVDAGNLPAFRAPAWERGFRARVGSELAKSGFQESLMSQLSEVSRVSGAPGEDTSPKAHAARVEKAIADTYTHFSSQLNPGDLYAREAFDGVAQAVTQGFRARAIDTFSAQYEALSKQKIADDLTERVVALGTAPEADVAALTTNLKDGFDYTWAHELPAAEARPFFIKQAVTPAVEQLIAKRDFQTALTLIERVQNLDLTGKGGLLGKTSDGDMLNALTERVVTHQRMNLNSEYEAQQKTRAMVVSTGQSTAISDLEKMRADNGGQLVSAQKDTLIKAFADSHQGSPEAIDAYRTTVEAHYDHAEKQAYDPKLESNLLLSSDSLDPAQIASTRTALEAGFASGLISPTARQSIESRLRAAESLHGLTDERDYANARLDLYGRIDKYTGDFVINFGDGPAGFLNSEVTSARWAKLPTPLRAQHEQAVSAFFAKAYEDKLRALGDHKNVTAEKLVTARADATVEARKHAVSLLGDMTAKMAKEETAAKVAKQAVRIRRAKLSNGFDVVPDLSGAQLPEGSTKPGFSKIPAAGQHGPAPEADRAWVYIPANTVGEFLLPGLNGKGNLVDLPALARDMTDNTDETKAAQSKAVYGYAKSRLGFTPEEIQAGQTKHGVPFTPGEIDPEHISVFRNRAELERHWAGGKPDETFLAVGNAVDPRDRLTTDQFYLAQLALLSR